MAINYTYPVKGQPVTEDKFLIVDTQDGNATKVVTIDSVLDLGSGGDIGVSTFQATDGAFINYSPNNATTGTVTLTGDLSATGTPGATNFLRGDNTWSTAIREVNPTIGDPIAVSTTDGVSTISLNTVPIAKGGTNLTALGNAKTVLQVNSAGDGLEYVDIVEGSKHVIQNVRFLDAVEKGDPVYIESYNVGQELTQVGKADASNPNKMPAYGIADAAVSQNTNGTITAMGTFNGTFDTSYLTQNKVVYVDIAANDVAGRPRLTSTKPAGEANLIQNIGFCSRSNANNGELEVVAVGRTNATPNLNSAKIFLGNSSNQSVATSVTGEVTISNTGVTTVTGIAGNVSIQGYSPLITKSDASFTIASEVFGKTVLCTAGGTTSISITDNPVYPIGSEVELVNFKDTGSIEVAGSGGTSLSGGTTIEAIYGKGTLKKAGTNSWIFFGQVV
jgi:hypothetical protein